MVTPTAVAQVQGTPHRRARIIHDQGGIFVAVDGGSPYELRLIDLALDAARAVSADDTEKVGPNIALVGNPPICHGNILGRVDGRARRELISVLTDAGYTVTE